MFCIFFFILDLTFIGGKFTSFFYSFIPILFEYMLPKMKEMFGLVQLPFALVLCPIIFLTVILKLNFQGASTLDNVDEWKWKLHMLLRNDDEQEIISRERKDRRDFEQLAQLADRMRLHRYFVAPFRLYYCVVFVI